MDQLWAPWRMEYILSEKERGCIFCDKARVETDRKNLLLYRGKTAFVLMNLYPYTSGHLMVVPNRHTADFASLSLEEHRDLGRTMALAQSILEECFSPHGFNIGMNLGRPAGLLGEFPFHEFPFAGQEVRNGHSRLHGGKQLCFFLDNIGKTFCDQVIEHLINLLAGNARPVGDFLGFETPVPDQHQVGAGLVGVQTQSL